MARSHSMAWVNSSMSAYKELLSDTSPTMTEAVDVEITSDMRRGYSGYINILVVGPAAANNLDDVSLAVRTMYEDADGDLVDAGNPDIAIFANKDFSAGGITFHESLNNILGLLAIDGDEFLHGPGLLYVFTCGAGNVAEIPLFKIGIR